MCGLYGFVATGTRGPDPLVLSAAAQRAQTRGPHASGYSVWPAAAPPFDFRTPGAVNLKQLTDLARDARIVVGHARLATSGSSESWRDPTQNQPLVVAGLALAHNGNVPDYREIDERLDVSGRLTNVDSETILLVVAQYQARDPESPLGEHVVAALRELRPVSPLALIVSDGRELVAARRGTDRLEAHPLHLLQRPEGVYLCSLSIHTRGHQVSKMIDEGVHSWRV